MPLRRRCVAAGLGVLCCAATCSDAAVTCSATRPLAPLARVKVNITSGGLSRYFWLTLPAANATSGADVPLMLVFHGGASTALDFLDGGALLRLCFPFGHSDSSSALTDVCAGPSRVSPELMPPSVATHIDAAGAAAGFAVAAPQAAQTGLALPWLPRWRNDTRSGDEEEPTARVAAAEDAAGEGVDDVAFAWDVAACVRDALQLPGIGAIARRVYVLGWSQGAKLASLAACTPRRGFSAAAAVIGAGLHDGVAEPGEQCAGPVPLLMIQGGLDAVVPFCDDGAFYQAGWRALHRWAAAVNGCDAGMWRPLCAANASSFDLLRVYVPARGCSLDAPTALYWLPQLAHTVPAGPLPGLEGDFAALAVAFFASVLRGAPDATPLLTRPGGKRVAPCPLGITARFLQPCSGAVPWPLSALLSA